MVGLDAAVGAFGHLKSEDLGRAGLLLGGTDPEPIGEWPTLPATARYAIDVVEVPTELAGAVRRVLRKVAVVEDLPAAQSLVAALPDVVAVTRDGDVLSTHFAAGGSSAQPSLIEVQAAIDDAEQRLAEANHSLRAAAVRPEPAGRATSRCREPGRRGAGPAARVGRRDGRGGRGARPAEFDRTVGPGRVRPVAAGDRAGRRGAGPRRRRVGRSRAPVGAGRGAPSTMPSRTRPSGIGSRSRLGWPGRPRWTPGSRCAPWRSGRARSRDGRRRCAGPPRVSGRPESRRRRGGSGCSARRGPLRPSTPAPSTWPGWSRPRCRPQRASGRRPSRRGPRRRPDSAPRAPRCGR